MKAAVLDSESARTLLNSLYSKGVIQAPELYELGLNLSDVPVAVGILSQARLVDVDKDSVRITIHGIKYIDDILEPPR